METGNLNVREVIGWVLRHQRYLLLHASLGCWLPCSAKVCHVGGKVLMGMSLHMQHDNWGGGRLAGALYIHVLFALLVLVVAWFLFKYTFLDNALAQRVRPSFISVNYSPALRMVVTLKVKASSLHHKRGLRMCFPCRPEHVGQGNVNRRNAC